MDANISKMFERAMRRELLEQGINSVDTFINCWWVWEPEPGDNQTESLSRSRYFPQVAILAGPDVPDGTQTNKFMPFRVISCQIIILTLSDDDSQRKTMTDLYERVRTALSTANSERNTWQTDVFSGCQLDAITIQPGPLPRVDELPNGSFVNVVEVMFDAMVSMTS